MSEESMESRYVLVAGSRDYPSLHQVDEFIDTLSVSDIVIHGGARGVDNRAGEAAKHRGLRVEVYPADWDKYGRSAGYRRNETMVQLADVVMVFWDGKSKGSKHTIDLAKKLGKPFRVQTPDI